MSKIAFIGPKEMLEPLASSGLDFYPCGSLDHSCQDLEKLTAGGEHDIIFVTERLAREMTALIETAEKKGINVVLLPDHRGSLGLFKELAEGLIS